MAQGTDPLASLKDQLAADGEITFNVRARPGASRSQVRDIMDDGTVKIDVASVAEDGKANVELMRLLAREFGIAKTSIELVSGAGSRMKVVRVKG